jgi:tetratricopeptide (TPR) repeat protein
MNRFSRPALAAFVLLLLAITASAAWAAEAAAPAPSGSILNDPAFQEQAKKGLDALYNMDFAAADEVFNQLAAHYPDHPVSPFLRGLLPWWAMQLEPDDTSQDDAFLAAMDEVIDRCDRRLKADSGDVDAMFFKSGALAFRGRLHSDRGRYLRAARDGKEALHYLRDVVARDPGNDDLYFGLGLFDYLADVAPKRYKILRPFTLFFPKGDRARGLAELDRAMTRGHFVPTETAFSLLQIHYVFEEDYGQALKMVEWLRQRYPDNSLFHLYEGKIYERLGRAADASRVFQEILALCQKGQTGYTDSVEEQALYVLSRAEMQRNLHSVALAYLERLENLNNKRPLTTEYRALCRLRRGMALDALGRRAEAVRCYKEAMAMQGAPDVVGKKAKVFLRTPYRGEWVPPAVAVAASGGRRK